MQLKRRVTEILKRHDPAAAARWQKNRADNTLESISLYWKLALSQVTTENTIDARTYLDPTMEVNLWFNYFEIVVVPIIIRNNLPYD